MKTNTVRDLETQEHKHNFYLTLAVSVPMRSGLVERDWPTEPTEKKEASFITEQSVNCKWWVIDSLILQNKIWVAKPLMKVGPKCSMVSFSTIPNFCPEASNFLPLSDSDDVRNLMTATMNAENTYTLELKNKIKTTSTLLSLKESKNTKVSWN